MAEYYSGVCRNCHEDCDSEFCSWECEQDYQEGYGDYLHDIEKDRRLTEHFNSEHAHELINRGGL